MLATKCPCGTGKTYLSCCEKYITQEKKPATPLHLMRSRYTAFSKNNLAYIQSTCGGKALESFNSQENSQENLPIIWTQLEILNYDETPEKNKSSFVEFKAHYSIQGQSNILHEKSEFRWDNQRKMWLYVDGEIIESKL